MVSVSGGGAGVGRGTLARRAAQEGVHTIISTGDKDLAQLVSDDVELINTMSGDRQDVAGVIRKFGVAPDQIVDFLMLTGDTVDNVPGVEKVGPKPAAQWLGTSKTVDSLVADADNIKGVAGQTLSKALTDLKLTTRVPTTKK